MSDKMFSFKILDIGGVADKISSSKGIETKESEKLSRQTETKTCSFGDEEWTESGNIVSCHILDHKPDNTYEEESFLSKNQHEQQLDQFVDFGGFDSLYFDVVSPPFQSRAEEVKKLVDGERENIRIIEPEKENPFAASLGILNKHGNRLKRLPSEKLNVSSYPMEGSKRSQRKLSTAAILRLAGENFIQSASSKASEFSMLGHPYSSSLADLSEEDTKDIQLVQCLLSAAEKVDENQFYRAGKLLKKCDKLSFEKGNPVQRLVHHFSAALHERIDHQTGRCAAKGVGKMLSLYVENILSSTNSASLAFYKEVPFGHVCQFTGMQAIIEQVADARKVHIIDLHVRIGTQYTMLMQALATRTNCPVEHLKITAIGINCKAAIEETGRRLESLADSFNLAFSFSMVMVEDMQDLNEDHFELDEDEAVAVYAEFILMLLANNPRSLESLMRAIRAINPCVMVVTEGEVNHNSPVFVDRFTDSLFYYGAFFDALADCLKDDDTNRMVLESMIFSRGIKNVLAIEGEERTIRHMKLKVWRAFFTCFGMVEMELSMSSKYQAKLILNNFPCGRSCTLDMDGKCLIVGWKGIPTQSLSVWKFSTMHSLKV